MTFVELLILTGDCDGEGAGCHGEDVPNVGVGCNQVAFLGETVMRSFNSKARADDEVKLVASPIVNPFSAQLVESAHFLQVLMRGQLIAGCEDMPNPRLQFLHDESDGLQEVWIHSGYSR